MAHRLSPKVPVLQCDAGAMAEPRQQLLGRTDADALCLLTRKRSAPVGWLAPTESIYPPPHPSWPGAPMLVAADKRFPPCKAIHSDPNATFVDAMKLWGFTLRVPRLRSATTFLALPGSY